LTKISRHLYAVGKHGGKGGGGLAGCKMEQNGSTPQPLSSCIDLPILWPSRQRPELPLLSRVRSPLISKWFALDFEVLSS